MDSKANESPQSMSHRYARVTMIFMELVALIAAPRILAKINPRPEKAAMFEAVDEFIAMLQNLKSMPLAPGNIALLATESHAASFRAMLEAWCAADSATIELIDCARALLESAGINAPPGGWDQFDGHSR